MHDDWVKQVKDANDIVDVVGSYLSLRPAGLTYKGLCPFHNDSRPSFDVDPRRQRYRCWSCGKLGDVISFVQEFDRVGFVEALDLLARRAGIARQKTGSSPQNQGRALMLEAVRWTTQKYQECLMDSPLADEARTYLGHRGLQGETVRKYSLGYAPRMGEWLVQQAEAEGISLEILETVGLIARRAEQTTGYYDRFRDRIQFPIRDVRGQVVGFGGRILPNSPLASRSGKYYNTSGTPLFNKSDLLYGLDVARHEATSTGYLIVVEGYMDVLMAHQKGVLNVVATMGTALNSRHIHHLRRFVNRVVLVFDADLGGTTGVDRALEIFASHDLELAIATLPQNLDPCDMIEQEGEAAFRKVIDQAVDALEFKLNQVLKENVSSVEGKRRGVDAVLNIIAMAPPLPGQAGAVKTELIVSRIARRLVLKEETVWARLEELRKQRASSEGTVVRLPEEAPVQSGPAVPEERELLEVLLAEPGLVGRAMEEVPSHSIVHPGLRKLLDGLYDLHRSGQPATLNLLRARLDNSPLSEHALKLQEVGQHSDDLAGWLEKILVRFRERRARPDKEEIQNQLNAASDHLSALELLRRLQNQNDPGVG